MASKVASLLIDVAADIASLRKDFDAAGRQVSGFGDKIVAIGKGIAAAFSIHEVIAFGERIQDDIDAMADLAENLKIPVDDFQALQNAALLAGQSVEATGAAMGKFNVFIGKASEGNKEALETLQKLGVTINNLDGTSRDTTTRLQLIATAITSIEDPAKRAAAEVAIFGKTGQSVSAILEQWKRPLGEVNRELQAMGLVHSPEVVRQMAAMADKADVASKQLDVLFAPLYAAAKSAVLETIAAGFQKIGNAITAIKAGDIDAIVRSMTALALIPTIVGAPLGISLLNGIKDPLVIVDEQIAKTQRNVDELTASLAKMRGNASFTDAQKLAEIEKYNAAVAKLTDLQAKRSGLTGATVDMSRLPRGGTNPAVAGSGVDKFAEAMRRLQEETKGVNKAIAEFQDQMRGGAATKDAERAAKLQADIANKTSQMIKDLTPDQAATIAPMVKALEELKFKYEEMKRLQGEADEVNRKYGDGQRELADTLRDLQELYDLRLVSEEEYTAAVKAANEEGEKQRLIHEGLTDDLAGLAAGFQYAMVSMADNTTMFKIGQDLFTNSMSLMSQAISEFVDKGTVDFGKLAASFAKMLADMAAQLAAKAAIQAIIGAIGNIGGAATANVSGFAAGAGPQGPSGGAVAQGGFFDSIFGRAGGGPVWPDQGYIVGEMGPERFVPDTPGHILPDERPSANVVINNNAPVGVQARTRRDGTLEVTIEQVRKALTRDVMRGGNEFASAMERTYRVNRAGA